MDWILLSGRESSLDVCFPHPCNSGSCHISIRGTPICKCPKDWTGSFCETPTKVKKNPVKDPCRKNPCKHSGTCLHQDGDNSSFICTCKHGWTGDTCEKQELHKTSVEDLEGELQALQSLEENRIKLSKNEKESSLGKHVEKSKLNIPGIINSKTKPKNETIRLKSSKQKNTTLDEEKRLKSEKMKNEKSLINKTLNIEEKQRQI